MQWLCALCQSEGEIGTGNFHVVSTIAPPNTENSLTPYVIGFQALGFRSKLKPNSITLAGSELAPNKLRTSSEPVRSQL